MFDASAATAAAAEANRPQGAVQLVMHRRLRTIQKRLTKIEHAEKKLADGGEIDQQQVELLAGKMQTQTLLEEFQKLTEQCVEAVEEDCKSAVAWHKDLEAATAKALAEKLALKEKERAEKEKEGSARKSKDAAAAAAKAGGVSGISGGGTGSGSGRATTKPDLPKPAAAEAQTGKAVAAAAEGGNGAKRDGAKKGGGRQPSISPAHAQPAVSFKDKFNALADPTPLVAAAVVEDTARRIISLLYFSQIFDVNLPDRPPFSHGLEREAALSYHHDPTRPVTHPDLDFLCTLGQAITTRPMTPNGLMSHHEAVEQCVARAVKWVTSYQAPVRSGAGERPKVAN
jgi:hypothetical protein